MTITVDYTANAAICDGKPAVVVSRAVYVDGIETTCDRAALSPEDALRLAQAIREPEKTLLFEDVRTGGYALNLEYGPYDFYDLYWYRDRGPNACDSVWSTEWPGLWADEIEKAAGEAKEAEP